MKHLPGERRHLPTLKFVLPAQLPQHPIFLIIVRLIFGTGIGGIIALIPYLILCHLLPIPYLHKFTNYILILGMSIGCLKSDRRLSEGAIIVFEKFDQLWQAFPDLMLTIFSRCGCILSLPILPLILVIFVLNYPQAAIRTILKIIFNDPTPPADQYRSNLWKKWVY